MLPQAKTPNMRSAFTGLENRGARGHPPKREIKVYFCCS